MMGRAFKNKEHLIADYQKEVSRAFYISIALVVLLALPGYGGQDPFTIAMRVFSEWIAGWLPQLDAIASTRDNPTKTKIVLSFVLAMMPIQAGYFLWTMPTKVEQEKPSIHQIINRLWKAVLGIFITLFVFIVFLYGVLLIPGDENPGNIALRLKPIVESDIGSGLLLLFSTGGMAHIISVFMVLVFYLFKKFLNRKEIQ